MRLLRRLSFLIYSMSRTRLETDVSKNSTLDCTNIVQKDGRVNSLANHETYVFVESLLSELQSTYDTIKQLNDSMILGDRKSKFITMS